MTEHGKLRKQITVGDDGELHQPIVDPAYSKDAIFCVYCSAANLPDALYCNYCGGALVELQTDAFGAPDRGLVKGKNDQGRKPKLATYDPSRYNLIEKRPTEADKLILVLMVGVIVATVLLVLPISIAEVVAFSFLALCVLFVSKRRYYGR